MDTSVNQKPSDGNGLMPVLFIGHGSPMNAIEDNEFSRGWQEAAKALPRPKAILCISAHWETWGTLVTAMDQPKTIHDFGGFPQELYEVRYPAPGSPWLADETRATIKNVAVGLDSDWGLDHGCWSVLSRMYPQADVPVVQLSLDYTKKPQEHYDLAKELAPLRQKGVLILGSGNIVHNLRILEYEQQAAAADWAVDVDDRVKGHLLRAEHPPLIHWTELGRNASLAVPTNDHYLPMLYAIALQEKGESIRFIHEGFQHGTISMRCFRIG